MAVDRRLFVSCSACRHILQGKLRVFTQVTCTCSLFVSLSPLSTPDRGTSTWLVFLLNFRALALSPYLPLGLLARNYPFHGGGEGHPGRWAVLQVSSGTEMEEEGS